MSKASLAVTAVQIEDRGIGGVETAEDSFVAPVQEPFDVFRVGRLGNHLRIHVALFIHSPPVLRGPPSGCIPLS